MWRTLEVAKETQWITIALLIDSRDEAGFSSAILVNSSNIYINPVILAVVVSFFSFLLSV